MRVILPLPFFFSLGLGIGHDKCLCFRHAERYIWGPFVRIPVSFLSFFFLFFLLT